MLPNRLSACLLLLCSASPLATAATTDPRFISFGTQRFDPLQAPALAPRGARSSATGHRLQLVQLNGATRQAWLDQLQADGLTPLQYYPHHSYLVWADPAASARAAARPFTRWIGDFSPDWKFGAELKGRLGPIDNVQVHFYNDGDVNAALAAMAATGARVIQAFPAQPDRRFFDAILAADAGQLAALADLPQVVALGYSSPRGYLEDEISNQIVAGNLSPAIAPGYADFLSAIGLDGSGVTWAVTDSGVDLGHPELAGRLSGFTYPGCPAGAGPGDDNASGGHGTHVAGIVAGAGSGLLDGDGFRYGQGIAPAAQIFSQNPICNGSVPWPPAGGWQILSKTALAAGAIGSNNSWTSGEGAGVGYIATARTMDFITRDGDFDTPATNEAFIQVYSAGNSGSGASTITSPKEAKNIISVANSNNTRAGSIELVSGTSSRGPARDGRTLPTITAPGSQIASTRRRDGASQCGTAISGTNGAYSLCSGTSMASPHAAGVAVLLTQWWRAANAGATPSPALLKALMINGAVDLTGPAAIPNNTEGWGRIHLQRTLADGLSRVTVDQSERLDETGALFERTYGVPDGSREVRISLSWTDAPGAVGALPALVNDLDLEVVAGGQLYRGNVYTNGVSTTGGSADTLNNSENVYLPAGQSSITVRVRATQIAGDGVPNVGDITDQDFALVCTNCLAEPTFTLNADAGAISTCRTDTYTRTLQVGQVLGFSDPVTLSASGLGPASVSFSVNPVVTLPGSSTLSVPLANAPAGDQILQVTGTSGATSRSVNLPLYIAQGPAGTPSLSQPANAAGNVAADVTFQWAAALNAYDYELIVARDAALQDVVLQTTTRATQFTPVTPLPTSSTLHWRVTARSACGADGLPFRSGFEAGEGGQSSSEIRTFSTVTAPGDCPVGATTSVIYSEDMETGAAGWTSSGTLNSWVLDSSFPHTGTRAFRAVAPAATSDQRLVSPPIVLPALQQGLFLRFWNRQALERRTAGGCYDGGLLEISTNGGGSFAQIMSGLLTDPYDGALQSGNPAAPAQAWCGDPQDYLDAVVDLAPYAGQTVQLRFRLTSDTSVARADGWNLDDVRVLSCTP